MSKKLKDAISRPKEIEEILDEQIKTALKGHKRPTLGLFLSAFAAGLEVGFSFFTICVMHTLFIGQISDSSMHLILAMSYPVGFIFVVIGRSELFTEQATLAVLPVLAGSATLRSLAVLWGTVFVGNLIGGYLFSLFLISIGPAMEFASDETFTYVAKHTIDYSNPVILMSGTLAGWLMGLLAWLVTASKETISRIFIVSLVTFLIGLGGLHHSIVGSIEVFTGMLVSPEVTFYQYLNFQLFATLGNILGGVFFVAVIKYSHTRNLR